MRSGIINARADEDEQEMPKASQRELLVMACLPLLLLIPQDASAQGGKTAERQNKEGPAFDDLATVQSPIIMKGIYGSRGASVERSSAMTAEAAVMRSLRWLKRVQNKDGSWSTDRDPKAVATALAVLAYLSHGETPASTEFGMSERRGIEFLLSAQTEGGTFSETGKHPAIAHGIVTMSLCEAFAMTRIPRIGQAAEKALSVILAARRKSGLWGRQYRPAGGSDDLEVSFWQIRALLSARLMGSNAEGLREAVDTAVNAVGVSWPEPDATEAPIVASALRILHRVKEPAYVSAMKTMERAKMNWEEPGFPDPAFRWHVMTDVFFRHGGEVWRGWNRSHTLALVGRQTIEKAKDGRHAGYWDSPGKGERYGRVYSTVLCSLMLQVYYPWRGRSFFLHPEPKPEEDIDIEIDIE